MQFGCELACDEGGLIVLLIIGILMILVGLYGLWSPWNRKKNWSSIEGTIELFTLKRGTHSILTISYSVYGRDHQIKKQLPGINYTSGQKIELLYDPNKPEKTVTKKNPYIAFYAIVLLVGTVAAVLAVLMLAALNSN